MGELTKACRDFKIGISDEYIPAIFDAFDKNKDGTLNIDEFVWAICGQMNEVRADIVKAAFTKLDSNCTGTVDLVQIRDQYNATRHPEVISGQRTSDQVLVEFLETFDTFHNLENSSET